MEPLKDKKIVVFLEKLFQEQEFWYPVYRLKEAGAEVTIVGTKAQESYKSIGGLTANSEKAFGEVRADAIDGVVIPGGYAPDYFRRSKECLELVKKVFEQNKLVAFICHAGWVPASVGILKGRRGTSVISVKDDMINAGCQWEDQSVVCDGNLISSRGPDDLPDFMKGILSFFNPQ